MEEEPTDSLEGVVGNKDRDRPNMWRLNTDAQHHPLVRVHMIPPDIVHGRWGWGSRIVRARAPMYMHMHVPSEDAFVRCDGFVGDAHLFRYSSTWLMSDISYLENTATPSSTLRASAKLTEEKKRRGERGGGSGPERHRRTKKKRVAVPAKDLFWV